METNFETIKTEILRRAKVAGACTGEYRRAYKSETLQELCNVVKDNFNWAVRNKVITSDLLMQFREDFAKNEIYVNVSVNKGFLLAYDSATVEAYDSATVRAYGSATVEAYDSATVEAYGSATVRAYGSATVRAYGSATVEAYGSATVRAYGSATVEAYGSVYCTSYTIIECKLSDNAIYRVRSTNTIYFASDNINFVKVETHQEAPK